MIFDTAPIQFALWLLPLPLLMFHAGSTGLRRLWIWGQIGALALVALLQLAEQAGYTDGGPGWLEHREHIWIALGLLLLKTMHAESVANALDRGLGRRHRIASAALCGTLLLLAALVPGESRSLPLLVGASLAFAFHELFASLLPGPLWQRVLRAIIAGFFASALFVANTRFLLAAAIVLALLLDTIWLLRRESLQRIARARESLKPQALMDLLSSTSSAQSVAADEESIPLERIQALLSFAVQGTNAAGGAVYLFREERTEVGTTARTLACVAAQGNLARLHRETENAIPAQILLSRMSDESVHAIQLSPDSRIDAFVLRTWDVHSLAAVPIRTRSRTLGLIAIASRENFPRFGPRDRQLLEFLGMQTAFSLHYDTVYHQLQEESRLAREFEIAADIQRGLLPHDMPTVLNLDIAADLLPAREVGGDYVDLLPLSDDRILAAIGDVSGKGLGPGMIMLIVRTILHVLVDQSPNMSPSDLVRALEEKLVPQLGKLTFMTFLLMRWNGRDRSLTWSGAGHEHIVHVDASGSLQKIRSGGLALGLVRDSFLPREERRLQLSPGDTLLFYTDGVPECRNPSGEAWGTARMEESILRHREGRANDVLRGMVADMEEFRQEAPAHDDRTLLVFKVG